MWTLTLLTLLACVDAPTDSDPTTDTGSSPVGDSAPDSDSDASTDSPPDDSAGPDDSAEPDDTGPDDSADTDDSAAPDDTGPDDTGHDDTGPDDTGPDDTGEPDSEDCANGLDDDGDGLLDCEDDECESDGACAESDCTDGADSDGDGLVDCEDDDCWSAACEGAAWAWVTGGRIEIEVHKGSYDDLHVYPCGNDGESTFFDRSAWQAQASGRVQFVHSGALDTCTWSASLAYGSRAVRRWHTARGDYNYVSSPGGGISISCVTFMRTSGSSTVIGGGRRLALESGCALSRTDFLPNPTGMRASAASWLRRGVTVNTPAGEPWYDGPITGSTWYFDHTTYGSGGFSTVYISPLDPAGPYPTLP